MEGSDNPMALTMLFALTEGNLDRLEAEATRRQQVEQTRAAERARTEPPRRGQRRPRRERPPDPNPPPDPGPADPSPRPGPPRVVGIRDHETRAQTAVTEQVREEIAFLTSPWDLMAAVRVAWDEGRLRAEDRTTFYDRFIQLCATRPANEQDALGAAGKDVFGYRLETFRRDLRTLAASASQSLIRAGVYTPDVMAEMVYRPDLTPPIQYFVHTYADNAQEIAPHLDIGSTRYLPPATSSLVAAEAVVVPSDAEDYGDQKTLMARLDTFIADYVQLPDTQRAMSVLYVLLSWVADAFDALPYYRLIGNPASGKSRGLQVMGALAYRAIMASGAITVSPVFRVIERYRGTLVIDEADFAASDFWAELVKILNSGYSRRSPVWRSERDPSDNFDVRVYDVFGPKILATREDFQDAALETRCVTYTMPSLPTRKIAASIPFQLDDAFTVRSRSLRNQLLRWRADYRPHALDHFDPRERVRSRYGQVLHPRLTQIFLPLLSLTTGDEEQRTRLLDEAFRIEAQMRARTQDEMNGIVFQAVLDRLTATADRTRVPFAAVHQAVQHHSAFDGVKMTDKSLATKIGKALKLLLLPTARIGGTVFVPTPQERVLEICEEMDLPSPFTPRGVPTPAAPAEPRANDPLDAESEPYVNDPETMRALHRLGYPDVQINTMRQRVAAETIAGGIRFAGPGRARRVPPQPGQ